MSLTEADIDVLVSPVASMLPERGFIRNYVRWAVTQTDAPVEFHVGVALTLVSTLANSRAEIAFGASAQSINLYTMIVGGSGSARKSTAVGLGEKMLRKVCIERAGLRLGSYEAMVATLQEQPTLCIVEPEFSRLLSQSNGRTGGYLAALKTGLTDAYDGTPISRKTVRSSTIAEGYRMSFMAAISGSYLSEYSEPADFTGGFLSRWLFFLGRRTDRFLILPDGSPEAYKQRDLLHVQLTNILERSGGGRYELDGEAFKLFCDWARAADAIARNPKTENRVVGMYERATALARRIATIYAIDRLVDGGYHRPAYSLGDDGHFWVLPEDLFRACAVVAAHIEDAIEITRTVAHSKEARDKSVVLESITYNYPGTQRGTISRSTGMLKNRVDQILGTLKDEAVVTERMVGNQVYYQRLHLTTTDDGQTATAVPEGVVALPAAPAAPAVAQDPDVVARYVEAQIAAIQRAEHPEYEPEVAPSAQPEYPFD